MRFVATVLALLAVTAGNASAVSFRPRLPRTDVLLFRYRAHDGVLRRAWLLLPTDCDGARLPLVISPHGRGTSARANERLWGDLPGLGGFAVVNPAGEGRRLGEFSWGDPGQIADLARMPAIVRAHGVNVDPHRVYAVGGSMGGQETLLLLARHPHLLAGAAAFDAGTDMARRYWDFAGLPDGRSLQLLARTRIFRLAESLGGVESLIEVPARMTHASTADAPFAPPANLVRLSVGIESAEDLISDLEAALVRSAAHA